jgi:putative transposase
MIDRNHPLPIIKQARAVGISRSSVYYQPRPVSKQDQKLMRQIDRLYLEYPFAGSRMLRDFMRLGGIKVGRKHVATLMKRMGIEALYRKPRTQSQERATRYIPTCCAT